MDANENGYLDLEFTYYKADGSVVSSGSDAGISRDDEPIAVTGVVLDKESVSVAEGESAQLTATVEPSDAANNAVIWSSDDETVATVDDYGNVTGTAEGTTTITATTVDGEFTASCIVTVTAAPRYKLVSALEVGKKYLIVNKNTTGSAHALSINGTSIADDAVEVKSDNDGIYIKGGVDATSVWTAGEGITLQSSNGDYLRIGSSPSVSTTATSFTYSSSNSRLSGSYNSKTYYVRYSSSGGWGRSSNTYSVYLYELEEAAPEPTMYTVTFKNWDGTELSSAQYEEGTAKEDIDVPTDPERDADAQYTHTFAGWDPELADVTADAEYTATYDATEIVRNEIVAQPEDTTAAVGERFTLTVEATGVVTSYSWQHSRDSAKWSDVAWSGHDTATLSYKMTESLNGRMLRCVVTFDDGTTEASDVATITLTSMSE